MSEIKGLLERANPDIQKVANLAIKDLEIKLEEKYQEKLNKLDAERQRWEKERENENEKSRVRGSNMDSEFLGISNPKNFAGDTRQHVMKLEAKVSAFESLNRELNMKIDELEQKAEEYSAQQGDFFNTEKGLRSYISKNSTENAKKILANKNLS
jgi:BMFP domain-containing protein YqiC